MSEARDALPRAMTIAEFLRWHEDQPETEHYELEDGQPILMSPERVQHAEAKALAWLALREAAAAAGLTCQAYVDGPMVPIGERRAYQPDVVLRCGPPLPPDTVLIPDPLVMVEVVSPSSGRQDRQMKLEGYCTRPALRHYLVVLLARRRVIHHRRATEDAVIETRFLASGVIALDPPGMAVPVEALFP
jgi:Uma2 family endonuclease